MNDNTIHHSLPNLILSPHIIQINHHPLHTRWTSFIILFLLGAYRGGTELAMIVAVTMVLVVMLVSLIGMSLPFILNKLKMDPAAASAPLITSIADICGVLIYFSVATWVLGL
ncbi:magnesium transporter [Jeotgalibacillus marinus]|uniref:Magnesium transporter n=1 Tax=Jeotgalibacillus marinus TaxID=86667 RepID=A0ABV3Q7K6_9BACL